MLGTPEGGRVQVGLARLPDDSRQGQQVLPSLDWFSSVRGLVARAMGGGQERRAFESRTKSYLDSPAWSSEVIIGVCHRLHQPNSVTTQMGGGGASARSWSRGGCCRVPGVSLGKYLELPLFALGI